MHNFQLKRLPKASETFYILSIGALALSLLVKTGTALEANGTLGSNESSILEEIDQGRQASEIDALIEESRIQLQNLKNRQEDLDEREDAVAAREQEIDSKLNELRLAEEKLSASISIARNAASSDVERILAVYSEMNPEELTPIFEMMNPDLAAGYISKMNPPKAAEVLGGLTAEKSYSIIAIISGRNAR